MRVTGVQAVLICTLVVATVGTGMRTSPAQSAPPPALERTMPSDIDPKSGFRLPLPNRDELDEVGKKAFDRAATPGTSLAGLQGPGGLQLYSTKTLEHLRGLNQYLRFQAGYGARTREIAILVTAREMDSQFEWVAHEDEARKEGVDDKIIDIIKYRKSTDGLDERDLVVIELGRQIWRDHKVTSEVFARAKAVFGPHQLMDLVLLMGNYAGTAALLATFDMQLHAGKKPLLPIP
jgi:4-carboxymuconolactone decarboxylase